MTDQALAQLLVQLFTAIKLLSGYPMPAELPEIHQLPRTQLEARICAGPCGVKAFYLPGEGVFIDASLDVEHDLRDRSASSAPCRNATHGMPGNSRLIRFRTTICARKARAAGSRWAATSTIAPSARTTGKHHPAASARSTGCATHRQTVDPQRRLAHPDRHALTLFAAGPHTWV